MGPLSRSARLGIALAINLALVAMQVVAAWVAHSTSLFADAGHNLTDVAGLALAVAAVRWALRPRSDERTFGNHRGTILAALVNSAGLAAVTLAIVAVAVERLVHPRPVEGGVVAIVAGVAVVANLVAARVLQEGTHDLNLRVALVHMLADVAASGVVALTGLAIVLGGPAWDRLDPIASLLVAALIVVEAVRLTRESVDVLLESTPPDVSLDRLRQAMTGVEGVAEVHDLHVWSLSSEYRALLAHLVLTGHPTLEEAQVVGARVRRAVEGPFGIAHSTLELECERCAEPEDDPCAMDEPRPAGAAVPGGEAPAS